MANDYESGNGNHVLDGLFGDVNVSSKFWKIVIALGVFAVLFGLMGLWGLFAWHGTSKYFALFYIILAGAFGSFAGFMVSKGLMDIRADPPHIAILTIWGRRLRVLLLSGTYLLGDYWPFKVSAIPVLAELRNIDMVFENVRCRNATEPGQSSDSPTAGGAVTVHVSATIGPDFMAYDERKKRHCGAERTINWLNHGGFEGVKGILEDSINEGVRHLASQFDWEAFQFMKSALTAALLAKVSEIDFRKIPREADGSFEPEPTDITPDDYHTFKDVVHNPLKYLLDPSIKKNKAEQDRRLEEIETFLRIARQNGVSDIIDLGSHISRLNVTDIVPAGALGEDAELAAREKKQREGEIADVDTGIMLAQRFLDFNRKNKGKMSVEEALQLARIDRKRATETVVRTPGARDPLTRAAGVIASTKN